MSDRMNTSLTTKELHKEEHLGSSAFITDIVIGMSDGLTVPFALAAGLSGAVQQQCGCDNSRSGRNCCRKHCHGTWRIPGRERLNRNITRQN